jgi:hypothetical protein
MDFYNSESINSLGYFLLFGKARSKRSKINSAKQDLKDHTSRHQKMGQRSIIVDDVIFIDVRSKEDDYLNLNLNYYKTLLL